MLQVLQSNCIVSKPGSMQCNRNECIFHFDEESKAFDLPISKVAKVLVAETRCLTSGEKGFWITKVFYGGFFRYLDAKDSKFWAGKVCLPGEVVSQIRTLGKGYPLKEEGGVECTEA